MLPQEFFRHEVHDPLVEIAAAEAHVAVGRQRGEFRAADFHDRDVERSAAKIVDQNFLRLDGSPLSVQKTLLKPEGDSGGGRLVDDVEHFEARHVTGILRGLAANFVEIGGHGDDDARDFPQLPLGIHPHFVEHPSLNRLGRIAAAFDHAMIRPLAKIALGALGDVIRLAKTRP